MLYPDESIFKTWLFITIFMMWSVTLCVTSQDKRINLKIGFDLTQGSNGSPSLRIRTLEDSNEYNPRAVEEASSEGEEATNTSPSLRADSSGSGEDGTGKDKLNDKSSEVDSSGISENDSEEDRGYRSTQGMNRDEYEPEENPQIHSKHETYSGSSEGSNRRRKRYSGRFEDVKRKSKYLRSIE